MGRAVQFTNSKRAFNGTSESASGDGAETVFTFPHGLDGTPVTYQLTPESADAAADHHVSNVDDTNVEVTFDAAPASGDGNVTFNIFAHL